MKQTNFKRQGKVVGVPLDEAELRRFQKLKPKHMRYDAAFARQLIVEGMDRLEAATKPRGKHREAAA